MNYRSSLNDQCWICGKECDFNVCVECGAEMYIQTGSDNILKYIEETNPNRFPYIMSEYEKENS